MASIVFFVLYLFLWITTIWFAVVWCLALFFESENHLERIRRRKVFYIGGAILSALLLSQFFPELQLNGPRNWLIRKEQRGKIRAAVEKHGGWNMLIKECELLASQTENEVQWFNQQLPESVPLLRELRPRQIEVSQDPLSGGIAVNMRVFGYHSTGGRGQPFLYLVVDLETNRSDYVPFRFSNSNDWVRTKITDRVYEIHR